MIPRHLRLFRLFLIAVIGLGGGSLVRAQEELPRPIVQPRGAPLGSISGRVVLPSGHPVEGAVRIALSTPEDPGLQTYTDNNGNFNFNNLTEGTYTIEVLADRKVYEPVSEAVRLVRSARMNLTIYLREKAKPSHAAGNVISAAESNQKIPPSAKKEYEKATGLLDEGKALEAIERLKRAISIFPDYLIARNDLGVQYLKLNRIVEATEQLEAAVEINSKAFNPQLNLGIALVKHKKYTEALDHLQLAASLDSSSPAVHLYLGIVQVELDDLVVGERELTSALSIGGEQYAVAHFYLAAALMKKGERQPAIRELVAYLKTSPTGDEAGHARRLLEKLKGNDQ